MSKHLESRHQSASRGHEEHWISVSDMMSGLMMVFLLIAISYMIHAENEKRTIREVAVVYAQLREELYQDLQQEFEQDLEKWGAELNKDLSIRFNEPEVLFDTGRSELKQGYKVILNDFFPRYLKHITSEKYRKDIVEVRIEGHTSSFWNLGTSRREAYFNNMNLSQARTISTLNYLMGLRPAVKEQQWLMEHFTANGLSSSHPVLGQNGKEDPIRSQRVEFRIRTDAENKIAKILSIQ